MGMSIYFLRTEELPTLVRLGAAMEKADPLDDDDASFEAFDQFVVEHQQDKADLTENLDLAEGYVTWLVDRWIPDFDRPWLDPEEITAALARWEKLSAGKEMDRLLNPARRGASSPEEVRSLHDSFLRALSAASAQGWLVAVLYQ